jgi:2-oxoacid:acceptor oxidoreductase gamma subunit (pyruvate/2-ketoisovalerate family)
LIKILYGLCKPVFDTSSLIELRYEYAPQKKSINSLRTHTMTEKPAGTEKILEIKWHGRGGQGAMTAAKILAQAAFLEGYRGVTVAPSFGAERRGAPVSASARISSTPIIIISPVENPNVVVVLDHTLLKHNSVTSGLVKGGWLVVNSWRAPGELGFNGSFNIATADATRICRELGLSIAGLTIPNTAILGALVRATGIVSMASVEKVMREIFHGNILDTNLSAVAKTYEITRIESNSI